MVHFEYIWLIPVAIIVAVGIYYWDRKVITSLMTAAVLIAASGPFFVKNDTSNTVVFLVDCSGSMELAHVEQAVKDVAFSLPAGTNYIMMEFANSESRQVTDIEGALFRAMNLIRQNGHIYLFSDMLETTGRMDHAIYELSSRNISLNLIVPEYDRVDEVILSEAVIPPWLTQNQTASIEVAIESGSNCNGNLYVTNVLTDETQSVSVELKKGLNFFALPVDTSLSRLDYELLIDTDNDTDVSNNTRRIQAQLYPKPVAGVVGNSDEFELINNLLNKYADTLSITDNHIPACDLLIIADCSRQFMTDNFIRQLQQKVSDGMGLLVLPGQQLLYDNLFEVEAFADLLPVKLNKSNKQSSPDGCIVFIVDTSGSMQGTRLILAKGIVRSTIEKLSDYDKVGIVEFYGNRKWAAPIQSASNQIDLNRAVNRLTSGGGTVILPAIEEAYYGLLNISAASRHIVVITDGGIESADYESLLRRIRDDNINISFVLTGPATHTGFLSEMSMYGGGKFFHAADRFSLPRIDIKTLSSKDTNLFRSSSNPVAASGWGQFLMDINWHEIPSEIEYIPAVSKFDVNTILKAGTIPILSGWHIGLGKVVFSNSNLFTKKGTEKLFQTICRQLYRQPNIISGESLPLVDFEIKSCHPDYELAENIGEVAPSKHVEQIKAIDLSGYCMIFAITMFLICILARRLPRKIMFVAVMLLVCISSVYADYPETMAEGMDLYFKNDTQSLETFINAYNQGQGQADKKYALAWAVLTSQRDNRFDELEHFLLENLNVDTIAALNTVYAINGNFNSASELYRLVDAGGYLSVDQRKSLSRELANIALVSRQFDKAESYYKQQNNTAALMKLYLLQGMRDKALNAVLNTNPHEFSSEDLLEFSSELLQMGFHEKAMEYAKILQVRKDDYYFEATVFIAEMLIKSADMDKAEDVITKASDSNIVSDKQLFEFGILLEQTGNVEKAIDIHTDLYSRNQAIDCLIRIASLKGMIGNYDQAYQLWLEIWQQCREPFMNYQVVPQLLDAAAKNGSLADLSIQLEDDINSGNASPKQIELLIDIYTSVEDSFTPIEIVKQYYKTESLESLKKQYHICRKCRLYRQCNRILKQLVKMDAENSVEYLRQMAILAVERDNPKEALEVANQLKATNSDIEPELRAGLLSMLGQYKDAMDVYEQLIEQQPNNYELWLLWAEQAANASADYKQMAIERFVNLLQQDMEDDWFLVIVDALMNLQAPEVVLQRAYEMTCRRIASNPERVYLYRLAIDILSELSPPRNSMDLLLKASCYAPQRRLAFIREAMDSQGSLSIERQDMAKLLVFMNWRCSPDQYIKLGQLFLENDQPCLAEYLFRCNSLLNAENKKLFLTIADVYQRCSDFKKALEIMTEASAIYRGDVQILIDTAGYYEILGDYSNAYNLYLKAYNLSCPKLVMNENVDSDASKNIKPAQRWNKIAFEGVIVTACGELPEDIQNKYKLLMSAEPLPAKKINNSSSSSFSRQQKDQQVIDLDMVDIELEDLVAKNVLDSNFARRVKDITSAISLNQAEYLYEQFEQYSLIIGQSGTLQYLMADLAVKLEKQQSAEDIIIQCFLDNPGNRYAEFKLKSVMEGYGHYHRLAELLLTTAQTQAKTPHFWREITRLFYQAGDLEKAKWANAYASGSSHFVLQVLDYLFLYSKEPDIEKMKQYFRKYQVNCRKNDKYYALRWNYWDSNESLDVPVKRQTAYMVLSQYPQLMDEFGRYGRVVYPDRRDYNEYNEAYENALQIKRQKKSDTNNLIKSEKEKK